MPKAKSKQTKSNKKRSKVTAKKEAAKKATATKTASTRSDVKLKNKATKRASEVSKKQTKKAGGGGQSFARLLKPLLVAALIAVLIFGAYKAVIWFKDRNNSAQSTTERSFVHGTVVDANSGEPYVAYGLVVKAGDQEVRVNELGEFVLEDIPSDAILVLSGPSLYGDLSLQLHGETEVQFPVDIHGEMQYIRFLNDYKRRKFSRTYRYLDDEYKKNISRDDFIAAENEYFDSVLGIGDQDQVSCSIIDAKLENRTQTNTGIEADLVLYLKGDCKDGKVSRRVLLSIDDGHLKWQPL